MASRRSARPGGLVRRIRNWQIAAFAVLLGVGAAVHALSVISDRVRLGDMISPWKPFCWEFSSAILTAVLIPAVVWLLWRFPPVGRRWARGVTVHVGATVPYSILHVAGMVGLRKLVYSAAGLHYEFGPVLPNWLYEYRKDVVTYALILLIASAFRSYRTRRAAGAEETSPPSPDRLIARKLGREFVVKTDDVERIEANGNYVTLHADGSTYPLRESLASLERKLDPRQFVRVHRSHIVNLDCIREIRPWDSGDYRIVLKDGSEVKLSRRYRSRLAEIFGT